MCCCCSCLVVKPGVELAEADSTSTAVWVGRHEGELLLSVEGKFKTVGVSMLSVSSVRTCLSCLIKELLEGELAARSGPTLRREDNLRWII